MRKTIALSILGWGFYAIAEVTPLFDSIGAFVALPSTIFLTDLPLGPFAYYVMFDKPLLMLSAVPASLFLLLSFSSLNVHPIEKVALEFLAMWSIFLAIPDMVWPLGSIYYETLKYYFGLLGLILSFVTILLYCYLEWSSRWKDSQS